MDGSRKQRADEMFGHLITELKVLTSAASAWYVGPGPPRPVTVSLAL